MKLEMNTDTGKKGLVPRCGEAQSNAADRPMRRQRQGVH